MAGSEQTNSDPLIDIISQAKKTNPEAASQLYGLLAMRFVLVPMVLLEGEPQEGSLLIQNPYSEAPARLPVFEDPNGYFIPVFSSRSIFDEWLLKSNVKVEGVPLYIPDLSLVLPDDIDLALNLGSESEFPLNRTEIDKRASGCKGAEQELYKEITFLSVIEAKELLESRAAAAAEEAAAEAEEDILETQIEESEFEESERLVDSIEEVPPQVLNPSFSELKELLTPQVAPVVAPEKTEEDLPKVLESAPPMPLVEKNLVADEDVLVTKTHTRFGIDEINFKLADVPTDENPGFRSGRPRQGTFTKILGALKTYREKSQKANYPKMSFELDDW